MKKLRDILRTNFSTSTVHAIGFTAHHDFQLLTEVSQLGTAPGVFRYVEEVGRGGAVLQDKFEEVFSLFVSEAASMSLGVTLPEGVVFTDPAGAPADNMRAFSESVQDGMCHFTAPVWLTAVPTVLQESGAMVCLDACTANVATMTS